MRGTPPPAGDRPGPHSHPSVGPLVEEAALLLGAVEDKLQAWQSDQGAAAPPDHPDAVARACPECGSGPGAPCTGCPLCRLLATVRGERPEVTARVVDGALTIVRALRTLLPADARAAPPTPADAPGAAGRPGDEPEPGPARPAGPRPADRPPRPAGLQRIDIT